MHGTRGEPFSGRVARAIVRARYAVVTGWIAAAVAAFILLPTVREAQVGSLGDLVPDEAGAIDAEVRSVELFGFPFLSRTLVVQRDADGLGPVTQLDAAFNAYALNAGELPGLTGVAGALLATNTLGEPPFSRESSTTAITYLFFPAEIGQVGRVGLAERFVERHVDRPPGATVGVTGAIPARAAQADAILDALPVVELATVLLVALVVGFHFRAVGAPLVTLVTVGIAYVVSIRLIAFVGSRIGLSVPSEVEPVIVVLLFGVITDYSIFFLSRYRAVRGGGDHSDPAIRATTDLLPIVVTAGLTIILSSAALAAAELGFLRAFGPGMALAVAVGLLVAVTLIPAALAIFGDALFRPGRRASGGGRITARLRLSRAGAAGALAAARRPASSAIRLATGRPLATAIVCVALLAAAATGLLRLEPANPLIRGLPDGAEAKQAYLAASQGFAPGILAPTVVVVERPGIVRRKDALARLQRLLARQPGVAEVIGPADQPTGRILGAVLSRTGDAARYVVVLNADPLGGAAIDLLRDIERRMPSLLSAAGLGGARALFAGDTALVAQTVEKTSDDLVRVAPIAMLVVLAVLAVFLRALVAPLYLVAASVLALAASLGLTTYFFQDLLGYGELTYYVPFAAAVLLLSLGSDYSVFLAGRIWSEARSRGFREAIAAGGTAAARPISVAAVVLAASFALLAIVPIRPFRELAFAMSAGLLIDAFLVRTLLVPALMALAGPASAWPSRRFRERGVPGGDGQNAVNRG